MPAASDPAVGEAGPAAGRRLAGRPDADAAAAALGGGDVQGGVAVHPAKDRAVVGAVGGQVEAGGSQSPLPSPCQTRTPSRGVPASRSRLPSRSKSSSARLFMATAGAEGLAARPRRRRPLPSQTVTPPPSSAVGAPRCQPSRRGRCRPGPRRGSCRRRPGAADGVKPNPPSPSQTETPPSLTQLAPTMSRSPSWFTWPRAMPQKLSVGERAPLKVQRRRPGPASRRTPSAIAGGGQVGLAVVVQVGHGDGRGRCRWW